MAVRAVLLDFYGTLAEDEPWDPSPPDLLAQRGVTPPGREWWAGWYSNTLDGQEHHEHSESRDRYEAWQRSRRTAMLAELGVGPDDAELLLADFDAAAERFVMRAYPDAPEALAELRRRGLRVVICSNWDWDLDAAIDQAGLREHVDAEVSSARVGCRKPHPGIFHAALEAAGVEAGEAVFCGDSWHADVEGPMAVGIPAVHVWRPGPRFAARPAPPEDTAGVPRIPDLTALPDLCNRSVRVSGDMSATDPHRTVGSGLGD